MTNSKTTKRALVSSALAMFMCVAMLIGTTFAWFTDTASTSVNKIQAGTLDVALYVATEWNEDGTPKTWESAEGKTLDFVKATGHEKEAILWEPGCTYSLPELRIVNKGTLALKYKVLISGIKGDAKLNEVIEWTIGNVAQGEEQQLAAGKSNEFTISGHMLESAGNAYQKLSIDGIAITVTATQDTVEYDSNGNTYDGGAEYSTVGKHATAKLITAGDLTINETLSIDSEKTNKNSDVIRVTGGNHTITGGTYTAYGTKSNSCLRVDGGTVTIKGGTFEVKEDNNCIYAAGGDIIIEGGSFKSEKEYKGQYWVLNAKDNSGSVITVKGGRFYKFAPSQANTGKGEIVVAEGYKVEQSGDWYCVIPEDGSLVSDVNSLIDEIAAGKEAVLSANIETGTTAMYGDNTVGITLAAGATLNGNGNTLSKGDKNGYTILTNGAAIKNLTLNDGARAIFIANPTADTVIDNVIINGAGYAINTGSAGHTNTKLIVTNSTVNGWTSFANLASASFTNCSFGTSYYFADFGYSEVYYHYLRPYVTVTFTGCDFDNGFYIDATRLAAGCTITLDNCTCNGVKLTNANFADYVKLIKGVANNADVYANNGDSLTNVTFK